MSLAFDRPYEPQPQPLDSRRCRMEQQQQCAEFASPLQNSDNLFVNTSPLSEPKTALNKNDDCRTVVVRPTSTNFYNKNLRMPGKTSCFVPPHLGNQQLNKQPNYPNMNNDEDTNNLIEQPSSSNQITQNNTVELEHIKNDEQDTCLLKPMNISTGNEGLYLLIAQLHRKVTIKTLQLIQQQAALRLLTKMTSPPNLNNNSFAGDPDKDTLTEETEFFDTHKEKIAAASARRTIKFLRRSLGKKEKTEAELQAIISSLQQSNSELQTQVKTYSQLLESNNTKTTITQAVYRILKTLTSKLSEACHKLKLKESEFGVLQEETKMLRASLIAFKNEQFPQQSKMMLHGITPYNSFEENASTLDCPIDATHITTGDDTSLNSTELRSMSTLRSDKEIIVDKQQHLQTEEKKKKKKKKNHTT